MLTAPWLRNWVFRGHHLLSGVAGLRFLVQGDPGALAYSHQITAAADAAPFLILCIAFPVVASLVTACAASARVAPAAVGQGSPGRAEPAQAN